MALSDAQLTTLGNDIRANTNQAVIDALAAGDSGAIAEWYNQSASPDFFVWRTNMSIDEIREAVDWVEVTDNLTTNDLLSFQVLSAMDIDPSNDSIRGAFTSIFSGPGGVNSRTALAAAAKRLATNAEKLFATSFGTGTEANPTKLTFEGSIGLADVSRALELTA